MNPTLNKKVKKFLDGYFKGTKASSPEAHHALMFILKGALTDANFHSEAKKVDKLFPKAKSAKYFGKQDWEFNLEDKGADIAAMAKWDGYDIVDAIGYFASMYIGKPMGDKISGLKTESARNELQELKQHLEEKNCANDASKWSYYVGKAKEKFDVYPSAYANAWASGEYKKAGGTWRKCKNESVNELNVKTYRSAVAKGLERGDDKGREIATKAILLMGREIAKELKGISLEIKPTKVEAFHRNYFNSKPPMTGQYKMTFTGEGKLHKPDLKIDTKDVTLFLKAEVATPVELGGWGGPLELRGYRGGKSMTFQVSVRNGSVEVYPYGGGTGPVQFTRSGARLLAATAKSMHIALGGDGKVKHNQIKQFTPHKNESVNEILVIVDKFDKNKQEYGKIYYRDGGNRPGDGDIKKANKELAKLSKKHKGLTLVSVGRNSKMYDVNESVNEADKATLDTVSRRMFGKSYSRLTMDQAARVKASLKEGMVEPSRGHNYYTLTKDTPIRFISGHYGIGLEVPGVLLHNSYATFKGKKGAYVIDYYGAHFYVDLKNKFASKIAHLDDHDQTRDLWKNLKSVNKAPQFADWKKYMKESVNESMTLNEGLDLVEQIIFMIILAANVVDGSISKPIIKYFKNRKEIKKIVKRVATNRDLVAAAKSKDDAKFYELLRDTLTDAEFDTLFKVGANYDKVQRGIARESVSEVLVKEAKVKLGSDSVNFKVMPDKTGLTLIAASGDDLDSLQNAIAGGADAKDVLRKTLEKQLKVPVDIDYDYKGAGFRFKIDFYSLAKKVK